MNAMRLLNTLLRSGGKLDGKPQGKVLTFNRLCTYPSHKSLVRRRRWTHSAACWRGMRKSGNVRASVVNQGWRCPGPTGRVLEQQYCGAVTYRMEESDDVGSRLVELWSAATPNGWESLLESRGRGVVVRLSSSIVCLLLLRQLLKTSPFEPSELQSKSQRRIRSALTVVKRGRIK